MRIRFLPAPVDTTERLPHPSFRSPGTGPSGAYSGGDRVGSKDPPELPPLPGNMGALAGTGAHRSGSYQSLVF
ncbi:hypothetical protein E5288_WYG019961 [Bos mutus]|uniref:Uncharacterized protein n=1 Tax=Bos mutus TaxID=72004 RepID=A0A6B0RLS3_9CETA|nr:hypothetical protein [Bos mutus]